MSAQRALRSGDEGIAVRGDDLVGAERRAGRHEFVAGREDGDLGPPGDLELGAVGGGGEGERGGRERRARRAAARRPS